MISTALVMALVAGGIADFKGAFPSASVIESPSGPYLTSASGFEAKGLGDAPVTAARAFLARYGRAFGLSTRQKLVTRGSLSPNQGAAVRFERRIDGLPVFDGDLVVGVNASNAVVLVNASDVPPRVQGRFRVSRKVAVRAAMAAIPHLETEDTPRATRGWRGFGQVIRPVWRVDLVAARPPGDFRTYVDAQTGQVLLRLDLRTSAATGVDRNRPSIELLRGTASEGTGSEDTE